MRNKPLILIVEDEENFLEIISTYLESAGFEALGLIAKDEQEVIAHCERVLPDLVLLDIYLADGPSGIEIAVNLKRNPKTKDIKILFWSSFSYPVLETLEGDPKLVQEFNIEDFIEKTADLNFVTQKIQKVLSGT